MEDDLERNWYGMLTIHNVDKVADLLMRTLGDRTYTSVSARCEDRSPPEVRTGHKLKPGRPGSNPVTVHKHEGWVHMIIGDTYGVWGITSSAASSAYDPEFKNPYLSFDRGRVAITHRVPCGDIVHWVFAPERNG